MLASRRRVSACAAPGVGVVPISSVPEISMRRAQSGGRDNVLEALLTVLSEAAIDRCVRYKTPGGKTLSVTFSSSSRKVDRVRCSTIVNDSWGKLFVKERQRYLIGVYGRFGCKSVMWLLVWVRAKESIFL